MKQLLPLLLLFSTSLLFGQQEAEIDTVQAALNLQQEGIRLLQKEASTVFDKLRALGKFRKSQHLLSAGHQDQQVAWEDNHRQIQELIKLFSTPNPDSLLKLTRFYPDSVFQSDPKHSQRFKLMIKELLEHKNRKERNDFFELDGLNEISPSTTTNGINTVMDFRAYWPLSVRELEEELQQKENESRTYSESAKEELLFTYIKGKVTNYKQQAKADSLENIVQYVRDQKTNTEEQLLEETARFKLLRNGGTALVGLLLLAGFMVLRKRNILLKSATQNLLEEKQRSEELLHNMLPAEVARQLKSKASARAHKYDNVSVLFSDFQNFSQIAKTLTPEELVSELDYCFTAFDRIIEKHRLQKIKTIGDAYMCVGGLYTKGNSHVRRIVAAALEIQQFLDNLKKRRQAEKKYFFEARIGIHTGSIVAGVVGTKKFAFDIWGDTVNVAQQMEYHSEPGKVNISGETHDLVDNHFQYTYRGKAVVKNMKAFDMYFVEDAP